MAERADNQTGRERGTLFSFRHRRVRMPLSDGHMDVCLAPDASPETIAALRSVGEAALAHLRKEHEMATRAKFRCYSTTDFGQGGEQAVLQAVIDDGDPENKAFWGATPAGKLEISVNNPDVRGFFKRGDSYYLDITPA